MEIVRDEYLPDEEWYKQFYGEVEDKPETEQKLFALQTEYFKKRIEYRKKLAAWQKKSDAAYKKGKEPPPKPHDDSKDVWSQMLSELYGYVRSCILQRCTKRYMEPEDVNDKAMEASVRFMQQYIKRPDFVVGASFAGMFNMKIVEVLYKDKDEDQHISLNSLIGDSNSEFGDTQFKNNFHNFLHENGESENPENQCLSVSIEDTVDDILHEIDEVVPDTKLQFLARLYIGILLQGPKTRHIKRLFLETWCKEFKIEQALEATSLELYNRLNSN